MNTDTNDFLSDDKSMRKGIDELFAYAKEYRSSKKFKELLKFTAHFKGYAPYNAMLIHIQCPHARYVLPARNWLRLYNRIPLNDRRPIIILASFGPVEYVYDVGDTQVIPGSEDNFPNELAHPFEAEPNGAIDEGLFAHVVNNLKFWGIYYETMRSGVNYAGKIEISGAKDPCLIFQEKDKCPLWWLPIYSLRVRDGDSLATKFATILHELGHLFLRHIRSGYDKDWHGGIRNLSYSAKEFEAETVSWLVCRRMGIGSPSYRYLSNHLVNGKEIPKEVSVDEILKATRLAEQVINGAPLKDCWLYSKCADFKSATNEIRKQLLNKQRRV